MHHVVAIGHEHDEGGHEQGDPDVHHHVDREEQRQHEQARPELPADEREQHDEHAAAGTNGRRDL